MAKTKAQHLEANRELLHSINDALEIAEEIQKQSATTDHVEVANLRAAANHVKVRIKYLEPLVQNDAKEKALVKADKELEARADAELKKLNGDPS